MNIIEYAKYKKMYGTGGSSGGSSGGGGENGKLCEGDFYEDGVIKFVFSLYDGRTDIGLSYLQNADNPTIIDWGDGNIESISRVAGGNVVTHSYATSGTYVIKLTPPENETNFYLGLGSHGKQTHCFHKRMPNMMDTYLRKIYIGVEGCNVRNYSFVGHVNLTDVVMKDGVLLNGTYAFQSCYSLRNIVIPESKAKFIPESCFYSNWGLAKVTVPKSITTVKERCFYDGYSLKTIDFSKHTTVPTLDGVTAFQGIQSDCEILVPATLYDEWIVATNWASWASNIKAV